MYIKTQNTPNPDSLKFLPEQPVMGEGKTADFPNARSAQSSPLAKTIFKLDGVKGVFFGNDFVTVTKSEDTDWMELKASVFAAIMDHYSSGQPLVTEDGQPEDTAPKEEDSEVVAMIKEIIDTRVRPAVQEDGGDIVYKGFQEGVVFLKVINSNTLGY